jgi:hypothetical protein
MPNPGVTHSRITCFRRFWHWGVLRTYGEATATQHAGVETQRALQQRLAPSYDGKELPCQRLTTLQLESQSQELLNHSRRASLIYLLLRSALLCDITQRRMAILYRRFVTTYRSHLQGPRRRFLFFLALDREVVPKRRYRIANLRRVTSQTSEDLICIAGKPEITHVSRWFLNRLPLEWRDVKATYQGTFSGKFSALMWRHEPIRTVNNRNRAFPISKISRIWRALCFEAGVNICNFYGVPS